MTARDWRRFAAISAGISAVFLAVALVALWLAARSEDYPLGEPDFSDLGLTEHERRLAQQEAQAERRLLLDEQREARLAAQEARLAAGKRSPMTPAAETALVQKWAAGVSYPLADGKEPAGA
jgi:hypothetical protein